MFSYISPEPRVRKDHPLRATRAMVDQVLKELSPRFDKMEASVGLGEKVLTNGSERQDARSIGGSDVGSNRPVTSLLILQSSTAHGDFFVAIEVALL